jgi:hypothetical protein
MNTNQLLEIIIIILLAPTLGAFFMFCAPVLIPLIVLAAIVFYILIRREDKALRIVKAKSVYDNDNSHENLLLWVKAIKQS